MIRELVLIRGLPGSGKSTLAKSMTGYKHLENDAFFVNAGAYSYDSSRMVEAFTWCAAETEKMLNQGQNVVVSNTFVRPHEWAAYVEMANRLRIPIRFIEAKGQFKNVHDVPEEAIQKMRLLWQELPREFRPKALESALDDLNRRIYAGEEYPDATWAVTRTHGVSIDALQDAYDAHCAWCDWM